MSPATVVETVIAGNPKLPARSAAPRKLPRDKRKHFALAGAAIVAAGAIGAGIYFRNVQGTEYITVRADRGDIESTVTTTGNLNAVITVQVGSQVSGNIKALFADFNTKVKKGQLVAQIDPAPFQAAMEQARAAVNSARAAVLTAQSTLAKSQADLASARANVASQKANVIKAQSAADLAKVEADRRLALLKLEATSQEDYDTARSTLEQAIASVDAAKEAQMASEAAVDSATRGVEVARAELQEAQAVVDQNRAAMSQAQLNLDHTRILAPVDGTVESRNMDVGQTVAASFQAPTIFVIAQDLTKMQVDTNVGEADVAAIRVSQQATFTVDAFPGRVFTGAVWQIRQAPINVQNVITYDIVVAVSNADLKLFPGMTANVTIYTNRAANALRVPKSALRFRPRLAPAPNGATPSARQAASARAQIIYTLDDRRQLKPVRVRTGISDANYIEIVDGLRDNQELVVGMKGPAAPAGAPAPAAQSSSSASRRSGF